MDLTIDNSILARLKSACFDKDNMPRMDSELCVSAKDAKDAIEEIERLRRCLQKDPKTLLLAYEDGDHRRLAHAAAEAIDREEIAKEEIERLKNRIIHLEAQLADASWQAEHDRYYYESQSKETW
jgi:archaellum component FlaC